MNRALILGLVLLLFTSGSMAAVASASTQGSIYNAQVQVPYYVYTGQNFEMYVNNTGGFSNYSVTVYFSGQNMTGFSPTNTYHNFSSSQPDFGFQVKAPNGTQQMKFLVKTSAVSSSGATETFTSTYTVNVISPIFLHATVTNTKQVPLYNVTVNFYVDNSYVTTKTIQSLGSGQTVLLNYTWLNPYLNNGEHTLKVEVNNTLISINNGGSSVTTHFYYGSPPNYNWIFYIVAVVAVFMFVMAMGAGRRPRVGERKPKWRK